jgi:hypothetical protein
MNHGNTGLVHCQRRPEHFAYGCALAIALNRKDPNRFSGLDMATVNPNLVRVAGRVATALVLGVDVDLDVTELGNYGVVEAAAYPLDMPNVITQWQIPDGLAICEDGIVIPDLTESTTTNDEEDGLNFTVDIHRPPASTGGGNSNGNALGGLNADQMTWQSVLAALAPPPPPMSPSLPPLVLNTNAVPATVDSNMGAIGVSRGNHATAGMSHSGLSSSSPTTMAASPNKDTTGSEAKEGVTAWYAIPIAVVVLIVLIAILYSLTH